MNIDLTSWVEIVDGRRQLAAMLARDLQGLLDVAHDCDELGRDGDHVEFEVRLEISRQIEVARKRLRFFDVERHHVHIWNRSDLPRF